LKKEERGTRNGPKAFGAERAKKSEPGRGGKKRPPGKFAYRHRGKKKGNWGTEKKKSTRRGGWGDEYETKVVLCVSGFFARRSQRANL